MLGVSWAVTWTGPVDVMAVLPPTEACTLGLDWALAKTAVTPTYPAETPYAVVETRIGRSGPDADAANRSGQADLVARAEAGRDTAGRIGERHADPGHDAADLPPTDWAVSAGRRGRPFGSSARPLMLTSRKAIRTLEYAASKTLAVVLLKASP